MQMCSVASGRGKNAGGGNHHNQQQNFWMYCGDPYEAAVSLYSMICTVLCNRGTLDINVPQFAELFFMPCATFIIHQLFRHKCYYNQRTYCCMYIGGGRANSPFWSTRFIVQTFNPFLLSRICTDALPWW